MGIGETIKKRRVELGMTQQELADMLGYTSRSSINKIEMDKSDITQSKIVAFANALKTTPTYLMGWEELEQDTKVTKKDLSKIGTTPEKIKDDILNLKPFNNIVDAITFIKEYEVKFFAELDLSNKTINDVIDLVNNILENTQDTIRAERNR